MPQGVRGGEGMGMVGSWRGNVTAHCQCSANFKCPAIELVLFFLLHGITGMRPSGTCQKDLGIFFFFLITECHLPPPR